MKKAKRIVALLLTLAMLAGVSTAAYALPAGGFVPVKATNYTLVDGNWKEGSVRTLTYKGDGRLTKITTTNPSSGTTSSTSYKWKGNLITKVNWSDGDYQVFKYKGGRRTSYTYDYGVKYTYKFKWKKKTLTYATEDGTISTTVNGKNQIVKTVRTGSSNSYTTKYTYYGNGNRKKYVHKTSDGIVTTYKYNSKGYIISETGKNYSRKYTYKIKKGKILERICKYQESGRSGERKVVYSKWKKVSHVRNCDAWGYSITLG